MKLAHICTSNAYVDGWGYQENLLPFYIEETGADNIVIAGNKTPSTYLNGFVYPVGEYLLRGVRIIRVKSYMLTNTLVFTKGLFRVLKKEQPDIIMHHNLNFTSLVLCSIFCSLYGKKMIVDNHADDINAPKSKIYRLLYYTFLIGGITRLFSCPIAKFYGVSHGRCDFLRDVFHINPKKISFLPIGVDENEANLIPHKTILRNKYSLTECDLVVASGGKMSSDKGTKDLIAAVEFLINKGHNIKLVLFGTFTDAITEQIAKSKPFIQLFGWCDRIKTLELLKLADFACWPIHHTTLCEDAISCCTPLLIRKTRTTEHLVEGNGFFMQEGSVDELISYLQTILEFKDFEKQKIEQASVKQMNRLSYKTIAKNLLSDCIQILKN